MLFGLGFDTATEVGLLVLAGGVAAFNLPFYAILVLPILFAAGMCLLDTIDGVFMNFAYGWAFAKPVRKVFYNITITALSVAVALIIGTIELIGVLADQAQIDSGPLAAIAAIPLDYAGYGIVLLFVVAWLVALAVWRFGRIEEKWSSGPARRRRRIGCRGELSLRGHGAGRTLASGRRPAAVPAHRVAVRAARGAVALPAGPRRVGEDGAALVDRAAPQPVHPAARQVQRRPDGDQGGQHGAEGLTGVAVVQVPAAGVVGQPRVGGGRGEHAVQRRRTVALVLRVDDPLPRVQGGEHAVDVVRRDRDLQHQPGGAATVGELVRRCAAAGWPGRRRASPRPRRKG